MCFNLLTHITRIYILINMFLHFMFKKFNLKKYKYILYQNVSLENHYNNIIIILF